MNSKQCRHGTRGAPMVVCRVMADPIEGYVMARFKGSGPWLLHISDWHKKFELKRQPERIGR